jgi:spore maturation protein CgeB
MSLRFQHITIFYDAHIQQLYAQNADLDKQPYSTQHKALLDEGFNWANYIWQALPPYGYETQHVIANVEPMQKQWAHEHGVTFAADDWYHEIVLAQIEAFQPDILFINMPAALIERVRAVVPSVRLVYGWAGEPIVDAGLFRAHDLVLTCVPENVSFYRRAGLRCEHLDHAFYPAVLDQMPPSPNSVDDPVDLGFIGNMFFGDHVHTARAKLFYDIAQEIDLTLFGNVADLSQKQEAGLRPVVRHQYYAALEVLHRAHLDTIGRRLPRYEQAVLQMNRARYRPIFDALRARARPPVFGIAMYRLLAGFKVSLNAHAWSAYASNMRLYEATGVGTCLLTDWKQNIGELFEPDIEIVTYRSADEAIEKTRYLLDHDAERKRIAAAGQRRTLRDHTLARRVEQLDAILRKHL